MKSSILLKKLRLDGKEFITSTELKTYCKSIGADYNIAIRHLVPRGYLVRLFRGIFYVKSPEEIALGRSKYDYLSLVAKGIELKGVKNWYFGLHTALKLNNMTHEHFTIEEVISDTLFRAVPINIAGYKFRFVKLSPSLLGFGMKVKAGIRYSDPEKTILDFIYIWRYNGIPDDKIVLDISEWMEGTSIGKMRSYAKRYPKTVAKIIEGLGE